MRTEDIWLLKELTDAASGGHDLQVGNLEFVTML